MEIREKIADLIEEGIVTNYAGQIIWDSDDIADRILDIPEIREGLRYYDELGPINYDIAAAVLAMDESPTRNPASTERSSSK